MINKVYYIKYQSICWIDLLAKSTHLQVNKLETTSKCDQMLKRCFKNINQRKRKDTTKTERHGNLQIWLYVVVIGPLFNKFVWYTCHVPNISYPRWYSSFSRDCWLQHSLNSINYELIIFPPRIMNTRVQ